MCRAGFGGERCKLRKCGGEYFIGDKFSSPKHPQYYPDDSDCWYLIRGQPPYPVGLKLDSLNLEEDSECNLDYIDIYKIFSNNTGSHWKLACEISSLPRILFATEPNLLMVFRSDFAFTDFGFKGTVVSSTIINLLHESPSC
ncbi:unnamed protein product [Soboliphyme baturini]|uniref:CUB domain-containing protein n=1 Tax=Soboliphyme baturini TaxID=241478 RepID=A0A183J7T1_9BILA|nr:unnamed protein product [Soboliphyme baturini]